MEILVTVVAVTAFIAFIAWRKFVADKAKKTGNGVEPKPSDYDGIN
jgi:hypothetical protein